MASTALKTDYTFREYAVDVVMPRRDKQGIRGITREWSRFRCHIESASFANMPLTAISSRDIREWYREMQAKKAMKRGPSHELTDKELDRATIGRCGSLVSAILAEAVDSDLIETNPAMGVKPKKITTEADTVEKWSFLKPSEQKAIVACEGVALSDKLTIRFALGTGLRAGEQMNLELPDLIVDGDDPRVIVRYSNMHRGRKCPPKNGKIREVPLVGDALEAAREWLALLPTFAPSNPHGLVFPTERGARRQQGKPLGRSRSIHQVYRAAGVPARKGLHWHALRHTFATNLLTGIDGREPVRLAVIQRLMGHSSSAVTERYAHFSADEVKREYRDAFVVPTPEAPTPAALALPEITPLQRLAFGLVGAASRLAAKIKESSHVA